MILLLDNYDSFTWNLHHYLVQLTDEEVIVKRNDAVSLKEASSFSMFIFSPGPGLPSEAGCMAELIDQFMGKRPMLGICLGHQALGLHAGAKLTNLPQVLHGVQKEIVVTDTTDRLFKGLETQLTTGHYHSWYLESETIPDSLKVTAVDEAQRVMAFSHVKHPVSGVQFHPESVMTPSGMNILSNWLEFCNQL